MRKLEQNLIAAIKAGRDFKEGNTQYVPVGGIVKLYGNVIARELYAGPSDFPTVFNLAGWNTATTRSRINALRSGLGYKGGVSSKGGVPFLNGRAINVYLDFV